MKGMKLILIIAQVLEKCTWKIWAIFSSNLIHLTFLQINL
jgi:hypothetical protein